MLGRRGMQCCMPIGAVGGAAVPGVMPPAYGALRAAAGWPTVWALVGAQILVAISCVGLMQGPVKGGGPFTVGKVLGACCCGRRGASAANEPL